MPPTIKQNRGDVDATMDPFCDHSCQEVLELSQRLMAQLDSSCTNPGDLDWQREYAVKAFYWVRDEITYRVLFDWTKPVSFTLRKRRGNCNAKACLLVSLLRTAGIEAAFCVERHCTKSAFFCVAPSIVSKCQERSLHFSAALRLDGTWYQVDPTVDKGWALGMSGVVGDRYKVEFDGTSHGVSRDHVGFAEGVERVSSIANYMKKKSRVSPAVRQCFNYSIEYTRRYGQNYTSGKALGQDVEDFMIRKHTHVIAEAMLGMRPKATGKPMLQRHLSPIRVRSRVTPIRSRSLNYNCGS